MKKKDIEHPKLYFDFNCTDEGLILFYYSNQLNENGERVKQRFLDSDISSFSNQKLQGLNKKEYEKLLIYILTQEKMVETYLKKGMDTQHKIVKRSLELMYNFKHEFDQFILNFDKKL